MADEENEDRFAIRGFQQQVSSTTTMESDACFVGDVSGGRNRLWDKKINDGCLFDTASYETSYSKATSNLT